MSIRTVALLFLALTIAGGTAVLTKNWLAEERAQIKASLPVATSAKENTVQILIAKSDFVPGSFVDKTKLEWRDWPEDALNEQMLKKGNVTMDDFIGSVIRDRIPAGHPVVPSAMVRSGEKGFLAAVLEPGMRAVTVPLNPSSGVGGFVFPGDQVDVLLTVTLKKDEVGGGIKRNLHFTETLLKNVRVLGKDQIAVQENGEAKVAKTATLEVSPKQAEHVALAMQMGNLSLSLRSLADEDKVIAENLQSSTEQEQENPLKHKVNFEQAHAQNVQRLEIEDEMSLTTDSELNFFWQKLHKNRIAGGGSASAAKVQVQRGDKTTVQEFK